MNDDNKYYIPDIGDIYNGYELEYCEDARKYTWKKNIHFDGDIYTIYSLGRKYSIQELLKTSLIRVPFLTKEQIEEEGWKDTTLNYQELSLFIGEKQEGDYYKLVYNYWNHRLSITEVDDSCIFFGECKSINEFRYISKLLKI
jgi:hypothetical protein